MLQEKLDSEKIRSINENANKPSSKQPEWEDKGVGNDGKGKKGKGRGNKPRKGAGNQKKNTQPTRTEKATVDHCSLCGKDLSKKEALSSTNDRIIKDIPQPSFKPEIILVKQE
ncbi:hypothetical protein JXL19_11955, partial [bacterium]|nr:hypothetical protein [bacterium]